MPADGTKSRIPPSFGRSPRRVEDHAILTGRGRYPTDARAPGMAHAHVLRSSAGHARVTLGGLEAARKAPGVLAILTHADIAGLPPMPYWNFVKNSDGTEITPPPYPLLAGDTVRHVGEALAFIVAETAVMARNAADLIGVDYDPLPAVTTIADAIKPGANLVWPERGSNIVYDTDVGLKDATASALAKAHRIVEISLVNNRLVTNYMEPRSILAEPDAKTGGMSVTLGSQGVHSLQGTLARLTGIPKEKLRVITPDDVGGGFGTKFFVYREYPLAILAAQRLARPVLWVGDRSEHFLADSHGRDNLAHARLALDENARFLGLAIDLHVNMGAYLSEFGPAVPAFGVPMSSGLYSIPAIHVRVRGTFTNTQPTDAYRGAGRPEAAFLIERLVDKAARELGLGPDEIRVRNFVKPSQMPYKTPVGRTYDVGEFEGHMRRAMELALWDAFPARHAQSAKRGMLRGIGMATYIEACAAGAENTRMELGVDGRVTVLIGSQSTGQGHRTAFAQIAAGELGLQLDDIDVVQGDTARVATGGGTGGSKSVPLGAVIVDQASRRLAAEIKKRAADELETAADDLELVGGTARVVGTDRSVSLAAIGKKASDKGEPIGSSGAFKAPDFTFPNGTHIAEVEIDRGTGQVSVVAYWVVDDFGVVVNPMLLQGQIHGGIAQGIGQALMERTVFDPESAQLLTASFMDYAMPRADDVVQIHFETRNVPGRSNPLGIKGAGEAGTIGACPAVMNAVVDALHRHNGTLHIDMPATPERVWRAMRGEGVGQQAAGSR